MNLRICLFIFFSTLFISSCDDGDIVVTSFDFDEETVQLCTTVEGNATNLTTKYTFFKINADTQETLAFTVTTQEPVLTQPRTESYNFTLGSSDDQIIYRRFSGAVTQDYFCNSLPPTNPRAIDEYASDEGSVSINTSGDEDDDDGIPADAERSLTNYDPENFPEESTAEDIDGDGIPNFYDFDDDGDNVLTANEGVVLVTNIFGNQVIDFENSQDSDFDGLPDFMDNDDDGDGVLTIDEDANGNLNPRDDVSLNGDVPDYLNNLVANDNEISAYRRHQYQLQNIRLTININNIVFRNLNSDDSILQTQIFFGEYRAPSITVRVTPEF
ncbi:MAG: hypothetical protein WBG71_09835 [Leeuwenhoekiella sp.]